MSSKFWTEAFKWGVLTAIVAVALPDASMASSIGTSLSTFRTTDLNEVPGLISGVSYAGGAILGISGALKLKQHAENPAQNPMAPGIARLLAGGSIAALPELLKTASETAHLDGTATYTALSALN